MTFYQQSAQRRSSRSPGVEVETGRGGEMKTIKPKTHASRAESPPSRRRSPTQFGPQGVHGIVLYKSIAYTEGVVPGGRLQGVEGRSAKIEEWVYQVAGNLKWLRPRSSRSWLLKAFLEFENMPLPHHG
jgi:hypothetical protein